MQQDFDFCSCPISGVRFERNFSKYHFSVRVGSYSKMDYALLSNQKHYHDCYELVLVVSGQGTFIHGDNSSVLSLGDFFLSEPFAEHEIRVNASESLIIIYFLIDIQKKLDSKSIAFEEKLLDHFLAEHSHTVKGKKHLLSYLHFFENYNFSANNKNCYWVVKAIENFMFECLELASKPVSQYEASNSLHGHVLERAIDFIDQNVDRQLTAKEIAEHVFTSKRNLYTLFNKHLDRSVHDYVNLRKITLAAHYLNMNLSVTESARLIGVDSLSRFNRLFRKYMDMPPSEYRKKNNPNKTGYGRRLSYGGEMGGRIENRT